MDGMILDAEWRMNEGSQLRIRPPEGFPDEIRAVARELTEFYTKPEFRNQGMGRELMEKVCKEADEAGFALIIHVKPEDETTEKVRLQKFYAKFGFAVFQMNPLLMCRVAKGSAH